MGALPILAAVSTVASAGGQLLSAYGQAKSMKAQAKQEELNAKIADTRAMQVDAERRQELDRSIGSIIATRAGDLGGLSPTALAFIDEANTNINNTRLREVANEKQRAADFRYAAKSLRSSARVSLLSGAFQAGTSLLQGGYNTYASLSGRSPNFGYRGTGITGGGR